MQFHNMAVSNVNGRGYAQDALLDYQENLKLFVDRGAIVESKDTMQDENEQEISDQENAVCNVGFSPNMQNNYKSTKVSTSADSNSKERPTKLNNFYKFCFSKRRSQNEMIEEDMEINVEYLIKSPKLRNQNV